MKVKIYVNTEKKELKSTLEGIVEIERELEFECEVEISLYENLHLI